MRLLQLVAIPWFIYILVLAEALSVSHLWQALLYSSHSTRQFGLAAPSSVHRLDSSVYCAIASGMPFVIRLCFL
jgi:hypothetical protein